MKAVNLAETAKAPTKTAGKIPGGLWLIEPTVFDDERGYFYESFQADKFSAAIGRKVEFVQDNHALSNKAVARGLHYQLPPHAQGKLVRSTAGAVFDVAVDIRQSSATFGHWYGVVLSAENRRQLWIPEGFAHGYVALQDNSEFLYKTTDYYAPDCEAAIHFGDPDIGIALPPEFASEIGELLLSDKDSKAVKLKQAQLFP